MPPPGLHSRRRRALFERYLALAHRRPSALLAVALLVTAGAAVLASRLELRTDFRELLPRERRSVTDLERIERHVGGAGHLIVVVEGPDRNANARFVDRLAAALACLPPEDVRWVDAHMRDERDFFRKHALLYADLADLERLLRGLRARVAWERRQRDPLYLGLDDAPADAPPPPVDLKGYEEKYRARAAALGADPDAYYTNADGTLFTITLRVAGSATNVEHARRLVVAVETIAAALLPRAHHPDMRVGLAGDVRTALDEYEATRDDLMLVSILCFGLIILSVVIFFRGLRALFVLGAPLLMGDVWTFAAAALAVGFLNASTMFLTSIIAGNGINFGIILLARYYEERRGGVPVHDALAAACAHTARATGLAAAAAAIAYGSLLVTDFRGFNQFGFIGGVGMLLCWLATFVVMPPFIAAAERLRPTSPARLPGERRQHLFVAPFAAPALRYPRAMVVAGLVSFVVAGWLGARFLAGDPFLYDFAFLRNVDNRDRGSGALAKRAYPVAFRGHSSPTGMILLADRAEDVPAIERALWAANAPGAPPLVGDVVSLPSLLPKDQAAKLPVLARLRALLEENRTGLKFLDAAQRARLARLTPPADLRVLGPDDLPPRLVRPFTDVHGGRGLLVYVRMAPNLSVWNGHDLIRFGRAVREVDLGGGRTLHASGHPVIFSDMIAAVLDDGPRAAALSLLGVVVLVFLAFRGALLRALTVGALLLGVTWLLGAMGGWDLVVTLFAEHGAPLEGPVTQAIPKLNFLNFIALPLTIGIGVDYGVNVAQRYVQEGPGSMARVLSSTGGAVVLCSLTTVIGYSSLLLSRNLALVSFGKLANLGELACLVASLTVLPAAVIWHERVRARRASAALAHAAGREGA